MKKLTLNDHFTAKLNRLDHKVDQLYSLGEELNSFGNRPIAAIVGTRKPTPYGKKITEVIASKLARAGVIIISGNALGVDVIAQQAAMAAGGKVISVIPSDLDHIYPATNKPFAMQIIESGGALLSEHELNKLPRRHEFLERNRIIAALSDIVIIPEAAERSGSLNTAKHAKEMNIPIGAVPGQVTSTMSSGTNQLLKKGAYLITSAEDVLNLLSIDTSQNQTTLNLEGEDEAQTAVLRALYDGLRDPAEIQANSGLTTSDFSIAISLLEVDGRITKTDNTITLN